MCTALFTDGQNKVTLRYIGLLNSGQPEQGLSAWAVPVLQGGQGDHVGHLQRLAPRADIPRAPHMPVYLTS